MKPDFDQIRSRWQKLMAEKSLEEIKAMKNTMNQFAQLSNFERELLILDLEVLATYKERMDFQKMMAGIQVHHDF